MQHKIDEIVEGLSQELRDLTLAIHGNPELGLEEFEACALQVQLLKKYGFIIEEKYCGMDTAYKASYKSGKPGPKIAMLAEYDALPGLGHGCGHNLIAMIAVGSGIAMREFADMYGGEIHVFGTPAEESIGGKVIMADAGAFDDMDVAMMSHPSHMDAESMNTLAIDSYKVSFHGKTAHAAAAPHEGVNALDAVINFFNMINALRQQTQEDARIHGIITKGGEAPNIIPDYSEAIIEARAAKIDYLEDLCQKVLHCADAAAMGTGCTVEIGPGGGKFLDTNSNLVLSALNARQMKALGLDLLPSSSTPLPASSDLGDVSYRCPAIQNTFAMIDEAVGGPHTAAFAEAAASDRAIERGLLFIKGFVLTAIELMTKPEELVKIKEEFEKISRRP